MRCAIKHFSLTLKCFPKNTSSSIQFKINKANNKDNKLLKLSTFCAKNSFCAKIRIQGENPFLFGMDNQYIGHISLDIYWSPMLCVSSSSERALKWVEICRVFYAQRAP